MGLDLENFDGNVPAEFLCPNCHCVVYEPMLAECSHVFCSKCFKKRSKRNKRCPACGQELSHSFTPVNIEWQNTYEALQINCTKGCGKVVRLGDLQKHLNKFCPLSFVPCRNTGCTRKVRRRDILVHLRQCDFRMVSCEGCELETRYVNLRMHQIVRKCVRQRNLHAIVQNKRELDAEVKRHRLQLQEESFKRELEDRDAEKAKMLDAIARQNPGRAVSAPTSTRKTLAITASRHQLSMSAFSHFSQTAPVSLGPQKLISDTGILCANCNKLFIAQLNHKQACKWHRGIVDVMFGFDRWAWSSKDGKVELPKTSFVLPSANWAWEADWYIDRGIPGDIQGWQYALDFPRTYYPEKHRSSCVRRRMWTRYYRFDGYGKWLKIPGITDDPTQQPFQDIAVGGTDIPGMEPGYLAVWAVSFHGKMVYREGVTTEKCPEGKFWKEVPSPDVSVVQLSVNKTGIVWGVTWEGVSVVRVGVTYHEPTGTEWLQVDQPKPSCSLFQVSAGVNSVWALTKDGNAWFRKGVSSNRAKVTNEEATGTSWVEMVGKFTLLSLGANDQVFALSTLGDHLYFRTDVIADELVGRQWKIIKTSRSPDQRNSAANLDQISIGSEYDNNSGNSNPLECEEPLQESSLPLHIEFLTWLSSGSCDIDTAFFSSNHKRLVSSISSMSLLGVSSSFREAPWRKSMLQLLRGRDEREVDQFEDYEKAISHGTWFKKAHCLLLLDKLYNLWCDCVLKLDPGDKDRPGALLFYYEKNSVYEEVLIPFVEITCVSIFHKMSRNHCFAVHTPLKTVAKNPLVICTGSEKDLNDWVTSIANAAAQVHKSEGPASSRAIWAVSTRGDVFFSEPPPEDVPLRPNQLYWRQVGGHMKHVEAGCAGVVWGIGYDGVPYAYTGGYGGGIFTGFASSSHGIYQQEDFDTYVIYENQRWNPIEGFSDRRLPSDRWNWSDESGVYERTREGHALPSSQWQWCGQWTQETRPGVTNDEGWQFAVDFPRNYHPEKSWNDYVRRRRWYRRCKLVTTGPWIQVTPPIKLQDVSIQIDPRDSVDECMAVWAVDVKGNVLFRHGVTRQFPQGTGWEHVPTDIPFKSISMGCKHRVWSVAKNGTAYFRAGFSGNKKTGDRWFHISERHPHLKQISVGRLAVWARDKYDALWYRVDVTENDTYPEGTSWREQHCTVSQLSCGPRNQLWMCHRDAVEWRCGVKEGNPHGDGWEIALSECWRSVTVRADGPEEKVIEEQDVSRSVQESLNMSMQGEIDIGDCDIYSAYRTHDEVKASSDEDDDGDDDNCR